MTRARSLILIVLAIFAVYIAMQSPTTSAHTIRAGITSVGGGVGHLWDFVTALFTGK
jgi:hypothetical protein